MAGKNKYKILLVVVAIGWIIEEASRNGSRKSRIIRTDHLHRGNRKIPKRRERICAKTFNNYSFWCAPTIKTSYVHFLITKYRFILNFVIVCLLSRLRYASDIKIYHFKENQSVENSFEKIQRNASEIQKQKQTLF